MKDFYIDIANGGDIEKVGFDIAFTESDSEWLQNKIWIKFKTFIGELWLNTGKGIQYFEYVLVKNPDLQFIETLFKDVILEEDMIEELLKFEFLEFDSLNHSISFRWEAKMVTGELVGGEV